MYKVILACAALAFSFAAATAATPVHFESGSARVDGMAHAQYKAKPNHNHKKKVWVRAHRSHGHWVKGHYVWR